MDAFLLLLVGLFVGFGLCYAYNSGQKARSEAQFQELLRQSKEQAAEQAVKRSSATLKGQIGERFAPFVDGFGHAPADARFLGSPVDYVVFDGLSEGQISGVSFIEVKTGPLPLTPFQRQVQEAIKGGRVTWRVVELPDQTSDVSNAPVSRGPEQARDRAR